MTRHIYIAGPLFNSHERAYLTQITTRLETLSYPCFLPHRDAGLVGNLTHFENRQRIFQADMLALEACDLVVALLTGADHDSGTCGELGYAYAKGKPCYGITDDLRGMNNLIWGLCGEGARIAPDIETLVALVTRDCPPDS